MLRKYSALSYRIGFYFNDFKFAKERDENGLARD